MSSFNSALDAVAGIWEHYAARAGRDYRAAGDAIDQKFVDSAFDVYARDYPDVDPIALRSEFFNALRGRLNAAQGTGLTDFSDAAYAAYQGSNHGELSPEELDDLLDTSLRYINGTGDRMRVQARKAQTPADVLDDFLSDEDYAF